MSVRPPRSARTVNSAPFRAPPRPSGDSSKFRGFATASTRAKRCRRASIPARNPLRRRRSCVPRKRLQHRSCHFRESSRPTLSRQDARPAAPARERRCGHRKSSARRPGFAPATASPSLPGGVADMRHPMLRNCACGEADEAVSHRRSLPLRPRLQRSVARPHRDTRTAPQPRPDGPALSLARPMRTRASHRP